ncbi:uncharacterized protein [Lepidochelys kempii]|uniref:uncharacterized protein n=1 Tax=Lepidochelys kempii TaxID=8472 RepID=UPI003C702069
MQSSSAQVTMMESQNRKRAPAWTEREVWDLIAVWGEESVLSELRSSFRNAKTFVKISQGMKDRGHNRDPKQCRMKLKELRQAYQKTREANSRSGSEPQTCRFYDELHAILGGSATTTPAVLFDSFNGDGGNTEAGFGDEEDDDDEEVVDSSQQASGETGFPDSQELFLTLDLEPVPPEPTQGCLLDPAGGEGTSAACVSMITGSSPSQRLVKLRKKKKRTRDEIFSELMLSSHTDRAQMNAWRCLSAVYHLLYAFPPFLLVHKFLLKVRRDRASMILIAPAWPCQHWLTTLLDLLVDMPITLPLVPDLITQDHGHLQHPNLESLHLTAWKLCG